MTIYILYSGNWDEQNIAGIFSSIDKADEYRKTSKLTDLSPTCRELELDPSLPEPYTKGLQPYRVSILMADSMGGKSIDCKVLNQRTFAEEDLKRHSPYIEA